MPADAAAAGSAVGIKHLRKGSRRVSARDSRSAAGGKGSVVERVDGRSRSQRCCGGRRSQG